VQNLARYLVRGDAEAEDTAQEAMLVVLERLDAFRGEGRFVAWVDGVVMRVAVGRQRKQRRRGRHHVDAPSAVEEVASTASSGSRYVLRREAVTALDALPLSQRHVVVLHHVLGYSVREIAGELDLPGETVRSRLRLGISKLRASFVGAEEGPSADAPLPPGGSRQRPPARGDEEGTT
jgi:RNA polymerase sigma-70 factor (ECF subfamily)